MVKTLIIEYDSVDGLKRGLRKIKVLFNDKAIFKSDGNRHTSF